MLSKFYITLIILLFTEIILQTCNTTSARSRNECFSFSLPKEYCCFQGINSNCVKIENTLNIILDDLQSYDISPKLPFI